LLCGILRRLRAGGARARHRGRRWRARRDRLVRRAAARGPDVGARLCAPRGGAPRRAGPHRRSAFRQDRPARGVPELRHHAAHVSLGRLLLDPFAAAVLAAPVARQSLLLYGGWLPLWIFRRIGFPAGGEPRDSRRVPAGRILAESGTAQSGLQAEVVMVTPESI